MGSQVQCQSLCGLQHAKPQLSLTSDPPDRTKYHGYLVDKSARSYSPLSRSSHLRLGQWSRDSQQSHPLPALSAGLRQIQVKSAYATAIVQVKTAAHTQDTFCLRVAFRPRQQHARHGWLHSRRDRSGTIRTNLMSDLRFRMGSHVVFKGLPGALLILYLFT